MCDSPDYLTVHIKHNWMSHIKNVPDFLYYAGPTLHFIQEHNVGSDDNRRLETGEDGGISDCVTMLAQDECPFIVIQQKNNIK